VITRRTLLLFQFGVCITFLVIGTLSTYAIETLLPNLGKTVILASLDKNARKELETIDDVEKLRPKAQFYFDLAVQLKQAHGTQEANLIDAGANVCYILAALFAMGGLLILAAPLAKTPPPSKPAS
jgi:hypothetical protein